VIFRRASLTLTMAAAVGAAVAPAAAHAAVDRTETPIVSASTQTDIVSSLVRLHVPMPASAAPHPGACDWIQYERFRSADGPASAMDADSVAVLMPGILEGATAFDPVARDAIREAARRGRHIEVWAIDRRANCLEDRTGLDAVEASGDPSQALDYYYRGKAIDGRTFAGFKANDRVLADIGIAQTVEDYNAVLTDELPSQPWRESHVICGGHSLGGPLTEIYASWDFDGNKATTDDAGYRQCAGFIGFDTTLNAGTTDPRRIPSKKLLDQFLAGGLKLGNTGSLAALKAGTIPRHVDLLGISPETMTLLELVGIRASQDPTGDATGVMQDLPHTPATDTMFHLAGSPNLASYLGSKASLRDFRYTDAGLLGQIMDDNGAVYGLVRSSFGYFDGAPMRRNMLANQTSFIPGFGMLVAKGQLVLPQPLKRPQLVGWRNYDQLGSGAAQLGKGITTPDSEVTDATDFARILHEGPTNLTENWFPIRIVTELGLLSSGDRTGTLRGAMHGRVTPRKPRVAVIAGDGVVGTRGFPVDPRVVAPGYEHLDVLTAAEHQNNGRPEVSSQTLDDLIDQTVPR
jgi:hypothetical protein